MSNRKTFSRNDFARIFALAATAGLALILVGSASAAPPSAAPPQAAPASPPQSQSPFSFFFGGFQRPSPPPSASAYATETPETTRPDNAAPRNESGAGAAYCVRLCDGRFFPIPRGNASAVETCNSFCPTSRTKVFSGGTIDHAVARDGSRYADLASAFLFRTKIVEGCTCNGRDAFGLASVKPAEDPTLRAGDVVTTEAGFMAYRGSKRTANFTPIGQATGTSADLRQQLSQTKIAPADDTAAAPVALAPTARDSDDRQAQLAR